MSADFLFISLAPLGMMDLFYNAVIGLSHTINQRLKEHIVLKLSISGRGSRTNAQMLLLNILHCNILRWEKHWEFYKLSFHVSLYRM